MVLVDSSVWIEAARARGKIEVKLAIEALLDEYEACWCGPVKLEVLGGARREERRRLAFFFESIPYRAMTDAAWDKARELAWTLRDKGLTTPWNDVLIASLAMQWDMRLYADDAHFTAMAEIVPLRLYQPGYGGMFAP